MTDNLTKLKFRKFLKVKFNIFMNLSSFRTFKLRFESPGAKLLVKVFHIANLNHSYFQKMTFRLLSHSISDANFIFTIFTFVIDIYQFLLDSKAIFEPFYLIFKA